MLKISVIVPVYKVEKYLRQCVDSILKQTNQNLEVILVDDGSPDRCPQICDKYAAKDSRVTVIHKTNGGLSDARNHGVKIATGDYGIFIDSDDYWYDHGALDYLVNRIEKSKPDTLSFPYLYDDEGSGRKFVKFGNTCNMPVLLSSKEEQLRYLIQKGLYIASACNKMIKMELLKRIPFERGKVAEDVLWCAKLLCEAKNFDYVNYCFYCYRQRKDSIAHNYTEKVLEDLRDAIFGCCNIVQECPENIKPFVGCYAAYQFSTFIAVQSFMKKFPAQCVRDLQNYSKILRFNQSSAKVRMMYRGARIFGLYNWCLLIRATRLFWDSRRDLL